MAGKPALFYRAVCSCRPLYSIYAAATTEGSWEDKFCNGATAFVSSVATNLMFLDFNPIKMQELGDFGVEFEKKIVSSGFSVANDAGFQVFKKLANHPYGNNGQQKTSMSTGSNSRLRRRTSVYGTSGGVGLRNRMLLMTK